MEPPTTPGARIKALRHQHGWSQQDLAAKLGVSRSAIAQWETDRAGQQREMLADLASALGVSPDFLITGEPGPVTADERALLRLYREATPEDRQLLLRTARRLTLGG